MGKRKKKKQLNFNNYLIFLLVLINVIALGLIYFINVLPFNYFLVLSCLMFFIVLFLIWLLKVKGKVKNAFGILFSILLIFVEIMGISYEFNTLDFFKRFGFNNYKTENYALVVLKESNYDDIENLENKRIGHLNLDNRKGTQKFINNIQKYIKIEDKDFESSYEMFQNLTNEKIDAFVIEDAEFELLKEENKEVEDLTKVIYKENIDIKIEKIMKEVDINKKPFNVYISGIDTYGKITNVSRSDVNIIATIDPLNHSILLTNIPRDYYVPLAGFDASDKLTHAGIYGIETSIATLENLLDTNINYYVKVNFTSLINVVDALGGIEVNSNYSFTSQDGYSYNEGLNKLDGKEALSFVRERKAFANGDRERGENQQIVLKAIINKVLTPNILVTYNDLIKSLEEGFITNLNIDDVKELIKEEIASPHTWNIDTMNLNGTDSYEYTYSYKTSKLYVMIPDEETVKQASEKINNFIKGK